jgi:hypothetical protein
VFGLIQGLGTFTFSLIQMKVLDDDGDGKIDGGELDLISLTVD